MPRRAALLRGFSSSAINMYVEVIMLRSTPFRIGDVSGWLCKKKQRPVIDTDTILAEY